MTIAPHNLGEEKPGDELAMLIVGKNKAGKSLLASTASKPILFFDFDRRAAALAGKKGVYALTFMDPAKTTQQPTAFNEMLDVIGQLESGGRKLSAIKALDVKSDELVNTVVFDSVLTIAKAARNYVLYVNPKELAHVVALGGEQYRVPRNWHGWGSEQEMVEQAILRARAIKGLNVIAILHEVMEQDERSTEENPIYTGKVELYPRRYNTLLTYFNEVWRVIRDTGRVPKITVNPDGIFTKAATALNIENNAIQYPDIEAIIRQARNGAGGK